MKNHNELDNLRYALAHTQDALEACEKASGWTPGDTPLPVYIDKLRKERDELRRILEMALYEDCGWQKLAGEALRKGAK